MSNWLLNSHRKSMVEDFDLWRAAYWNVYVCDVDLLNFNLMDSRLFGFGVTCWVQKKFTQLLSSSPGDEI